MKNTTIETNKANQNNQQVNNEAIIADKAEIIVNNQESDEETIEVVNVDTIISNSMNNIIIEAPETGSTFLVAPEVERIDISNTLILENNTPELNERINEDLLVANNNQEVEITEVVAPVQQEQVTIEDVVSVEVKVEPEVIITPVVEAVEEIKFNTIDGTAKNDRLRGTNEDDIINGDEGNDRLIGRKGNDTLNGDEGRDVLLAGKGDDTLDGGAGTDRMYGGKGDDTLIYDAADRIIHGGKGIDTLKVNNDSDIDLSARNLRSIERIDLDNNEENEIEVSMKDVIRKSDNNLMEILGDAFDEVSSDDFTARGEDVTVNEVTFATFSAGHADLYVELGITFNDNVLTEI